MLDLDLLSDVPLEEIADPCVGGSVLVAGIIVAYLGAFAFAPGGAL